MEFKPGQPAHVALIEPHEQDRLIQSAYLLPQHVHYITQHFCISAWHNNRCVGVAGVLDLEDGNGLAWALLSKHAGPHMIAITRAVRDALNLLKHPTVYMTACNDFPIAHKWAKMLGFRQEKHPVIERQARTFYVRGD